MTRHLGVKAIILVFVGGMCALGSAKTSPSSERARCEALATIDFSSTQDAPTQVKGAKFVEESAGTPAYCEVDGYVAPQVGLQLRLPSENWNGKYLALGGAGTNGKIHGSDCDRYLGRGYACAVNDGGHEGTGVLWTIGNLPALIDDAYRDTHVAKLAADAIMSRYYLHNPTKSYFMGCSGGGYEGLVAAQLFPWDFDGIIVGAANTDLGEWAMRAAWTAKTLVGKSGQPLLSAADIQLLHQAVLAECDRDDGVVDGIVGNPSGCRFDPSNLACKREAKGGCLSATQIEAVSRMYSGPQTSAGERTSVPGVLRGSELLWNETLSTDLRESADDILKYYVYAASAAWTAQSFDFDRDYKRLGLAALSSHANPDLRKFKAAGGKLMAYVGGNDIEQVAGDVIDYYETTERTMGGRTSTQDFFRLFVVPGMEHCTGGVGAYAIDYLTYLEAWVEHGRAPDEMVGAHISDAYLAAMPVKSDLLVPMTLHRKTHFLTFPLDPSIPVSFTRPVYPYPFYAKYKGSGDPNEAANFEPTDPRPSSH